MQIFNEKDHLTLKLNVAVADNQERRTYGLMNLDNLPKMNAMIFIFEEPIYARFWMKNTLISLDIIFIDENNKIVEIYQNAQPKSLKLISSSQKILKVLEVNAGLVKKYNISIGNKIIIK